MAAEPTITSLDEDRAMMLKDVLSGLKGCPKTLPGKYLWDERGSEIYDRICLSAGYYPSKQESTLLPEVCGDVAAAVGEGAVIVEFGSGASRKVRTILDRLDSPSAYVGIDISRDYLESAIQRLAPDYPTVEMVSVCADYTLPVELPLELSGRPVLGFYPGPSIGNFTPEKALEFLKRARVTLGSSLFLVGTDATRDPIRLIKAYSGEDGLMAALHLNILARLNRECDANIELENFKHTVKIGHDPNRVEAHLVAHKAAAYQISGETITFESGESIRTDKSHKYTPAEFSALASEAGWQTSKVWEDELGSSCLHLLQNS